MRIVGFSVGHDKGATLIVDGKVKVAISQERLSRVKHDGAYTGTLPLESIYYCLESSLITVRDIDLFVYSTTEQEDLVDNHMVDAFGQDILTKLLFIPHHLAHAYSTFFASGFEESAVVVADASGSQLTQRNKMSNWYKQPDRTNLDDDQNWAESISIYHFTRSGYTEHFKKWVKLPVFPGDESYSVGLLYGEGSLQLIYDQTTNTWPAGKLMGLASYADQQFVKDFADIIEDHGDDIKIPAVRICPEVSHKSNFYLRANVAGVYQREQERVSLMLAKKAKQLTSSKNICVAGGSFLNCNSNQAILESGLFENCYFIPSADDSGIALGCAFFGAQKINQPIQKTTLLPYLGKSYSNEQIIESVLSRQEVVFEQYQHFFELAEKVSDYLVDNKVIGWFQDGSELGPRALGNRSILASPIKSWMKDHINHDIKKREWYRPFAPAVLYEKQAQIFESTFFSPYMLLTGRVDHQWQNKIPATVHIDGSARWQSVTRDWNSKLHLLISCFYSKTGVPVLLNTSFNGPSEPIVETPSDAINTFLNLNLDLLVIENFLILRK